jgi:hypothetical protein
MLTVMHNRNIAEARKLSVISSINAIKGKRMHLSTKEIVPACGRQESHTVNL